MKKLVLFAFVLSWITNAYSQQEITTELMHWKIQNSSEVGQNGKEISKANYHNKTWIDATVPTTVFNALVEQGKYEDIYVGKNIEKISTEPFQTSWWYRTSFKLNDLDQIYLLDFEGINYSANIWLNGEQIATKNEVINPFRQFKFQVNDYLKKGENILAIEVFPPQSGDFTIGFVDWNPAPPDNNMGIYRNVNLITNEGVGIENPYMESHFKKDNYKEADLIFSTNLKNYGQDITGVLRVAFNNSVIEKSISLQADENKKVVLKALDFEQLHIKNPKLWWPHTIGEPNLYNAKVTFTADTKVYDAAEFDFGIREVSDFFTASGHRGFKVNGEKISIRGGGWVDNLILNDTKDYIQSQLEYVKDMNLNSIRLEGFWGKDHTIYELCDQLGILIMVGWSCQWEWENYLGKPVDEKYGGILSPQDIELMSSAWRDQVVWLRNHPSIYAWSAGSDCIPKPELEKKYFKIFDEYDSTRVYLSSAKEWNSLSGPSGVKMRGPYAYVPPVYWYADTLYGGAFGFNTETGPGAQVPPLESIKKMIPEKDLWPINDVWDFHCGRNEFNTLDRFTTALNERYGTAKNVEDYAFKAQLLNYELMRPMFEAFSVNRYEATGVIQWMLNSAWPEMYWQLYDTYLLPNAAYYATKVAGNPMHAIYNYEDKSIYLINDQLEKATNLKLEINVFDVQSKNVFQYAITTDIEANTSINLGKLPELAEISNTYFVSLKVYNADNKEIDNNFYWLSKKQDILDYEAKVPNWYYHTPTKQYANYLELEALKEVHLSHSVVSKEDESHVIYEVTLKNPSDSIAFFTELKMVDSETGLSILPVIWSDNYISLLPGETGIYSAKIRKEHHKNSEAKFVYKGWNSAMSQ